MSRTTDWIQLISGKPFYPLEPRPEEIQIEDIAWALSHICRYTGHVKRFYSVAEHCVLLSLAAPPEAQLWALLHDASEAYLHDLPRPLKPHIPDYKEIEDRLMMCVAERFGLELPEPQVVRDLDYRITFNEKAQILATPSIPWTFQGDPIPGLRIRCWSPKVARRKFLDRYRQLAGGNRARIHTALGYLASQITTSL